MNSFLIVVDVLKCGYVSIASANMIYYSFISNIIYGGYEFFIFICLDAFLENYSYYSAPW